MAFNTLYISNNRLFPTQFLATSFGIVNLISHLVTVGAPMVAEIKDPLPFLIFLSNAVAAIISSLFLREISEKFRSSE